MTPDLHFLTIAEAASLLRARALSPVDLATAAFARIAALDGRLNSHILVLEEAGMAAAREAEAEIAAGRWRGPLHGIPIGLKDIYNTAGDRHDRALRAVQATTCRRADATTVRKLREAGAVIIGKLSTWEFAIGGPSFDLPWPPARNPWDPTTTRPARPRARGRGRRRPVHGRHGLRHRRLHPRPGRVVRHRRAQADLRAGQQGGRAAAVVLARPCRADVLDRRGLRPDDAGARRPRRRGPVQRRCPAPDFSRHGPARRRRCASAWCAISSSTTALRAGRSPAFEAALRVLRDLGADVRGRAARAVRRVSPPSAT